MQRFIAEEAKKQSNMESIVQKAIPLVLENATPERVEDDWITNFFDKCRLISDEEMQMLWARILAGEANSPGSYSKRTTNFLSSLDKSDANLFTNLCSFNVFIETLFPLVYDVREEIYPKKSITFERLLHLESIGLIQFDPLNGYIDTDIGERCTAHYYGSKIFIEFPPDLSKLKLGHVLLTQIGKELAPISGAEPCDGFLDYIIGEWRNLGYKVTASDSSQLKEEH